MNTTHTQFQTLLLLCSMLLFPFLNRTNGSAFGQTPNTWTQKASFVGIDRYATTAFSIGNKGYMGCGTDNNTGEKNDFWEYDPSTNTWTQKANFIGTAQRYASGFSIGTKGYLGCGSAGNGFYAYDQAANTWTAKAPFPGSYREQAVGFSIGTKGYIGLGATGTNFHQNFYEYDPSLNTWTAKASFPGVARRGAVGFSIGSKGYVGSGENASSNNLSDFYEYNPGTNTWTAKASVPSARKYAVGFSIGTKGYVGCGNAGFGTVNDFYEYDPASNAWTVKANGGGGTRGYGPAAFSIGARGYIGCGSDGSTTKNDFWEYTSDSPGAALNFDGTNDYVSVPHHASLNFGTGDFTIESYFKSSVSQPDYTGIACKQNSSGSGGFQLVLYTNKIAAEISDASLSLGVANGLVGTTNLNDGNYHHLAMVVTRSQNKIELFVDGIVEATVTNAGLPALNVNYSTALLIGSERTFSMKMNGNMDEVRLWNVARTKCQLNTYKNCEIATTSPGLVANYHFNQGFYGANNSTVTTLTDASGNSNTGTLTNFALNNATSNWIEPGGVITGSVTPAALIPTVTASATNTVICNGATTTFNGGGANTYTWTGGITNNVVFSPTATANYTVTGTNTLTGCTNTAVQGVSVNPLPAITASATNSVICNGATTTLNAGGAHTYTWTGGVTNGVMFTPLSTQSYSVAGTNTLTGCTSTSAVQGVTVNALPVVTAGTTNSVICNSATTALNGSGADTYTWTGGITNGVAFAPSAAQSYTVTGTNTLTGCTSTNSAVQGITVNALPIVTASSSNSVICNGSATALNGGGANTYTWTGGIINGVAFAPSATQSYTVTGTNTLTGCTSTNSAVQGITVNALPIVTASTTNSVICNGAITTLNGSGADTYTWTGGISNGVAFAPSATQSYTVTGTNTLTGCTSTNSAVQGITVNALPIVTASTTNSVICNGATTTLNGGGATTYTWTGGISNGTPFSPSSTQSYSLAGTDALTGCTSINSALQSITVNQLPAVTAGATNPVICSGAPTTLNGGGATTYTWTAGISNGTPFSPSATQSYTVTGTNSATGCSNTAVQGVTVNPLPLVTASATNSVICNGATTTLNGAGANTYMWTGGVTNGVTFAPSSTQSYTVTGTNTLTGCTSTNSAVQGVTVNALPVVTAGATNTMICNGATLTLNGGGATTYTWTGGVTNGVPFAPSSTQSYTVTGTNALTGCTSTNSAVQSITVNALPIVTASTTNSVLCNGATIILNGGGATTYTWSGGASNGTSFSPSLTQSYTVTGTNATTGCTNTAVQGVTVNPLPVVTAGATNSVICKGATTTLNGSGANTYTWTGGVTNGASFSPTLTQSYTVTGTNATTGCTNTAVQGVTVNPLPVVTAGATNSVICNGATLTLNGGGATTYTWTGGVTNGVPFAPSATQSYTVTGTNALTGCTGTNVAVQTVTVNTLPVVTASISNPVICEGATITLNGGGADTFTWTGGVTNGVTFIPAVSGSYTVTGTNTLTGCTSTNIAFKSVTVNPNPVISATGGIICGGGNYTITPNGASTYTISGGSFVVSPPSTTSYSVTGTSPGGCTGNTAIATVSVQASLTVSIAGTGSLCEGQPVNLVASGATTYTWSTGTTGNTISPTPGISTTYSVVGSSGTCSNSAMALITVHPNPTITVVSDNSVICAGETVSLTASGASTYSWSTGTAGNTISPTPGVSTTYSVVGSSGTCSSSAMALITVNANPTITVVSDNSVICTGETVSLTASGATTYTWNTGATGTSVIESAAVTTTYTVTGEDGNGCMNTNTFVQNVSPCTGIETLSSATKIRLYPNPGSGLATLELSSETQVVIVDVLGVIISNQKLVAGNHGIDVTPFANGIYFVKVIQDNKQQTIKLIKE